MDEDIVNFNPKISIVGVDIFHPKQMFSRFFFFFF